MLQTKIALKLLLCNTDIRKGGKVILQLFYNQLQRRL